MRLRDTARDQHHLRHIRIGLLAGAAITALLGIWLVATASSSTRVLTISGRVLALYGLSSACGYGPRCAEVHSYRYTHAQCTADPVTCDSYEGSVLTLAHDNTQYVVNPFTLRPALTEWFASAGDEVRIWYTHTPLLGAQVVAIQLFYAQGHAGVPHTGTGYADAQGVHNTLQTIGILTLIVAAIAAVAGWLLPWRLKVSFTPAKTAGSPAPADP